MSGTLKVGGVTLATHTGTDGTGNVALASSVTGFPSEGITHASQWRVTTEFSGAADPLNLQTHGEEVDTDGFGKFGASMTNASGVFTFPTEGIWKIDAHLSFYKNAASRSVSVKIFTTLNDGSAWSDAALGYGFIEISPSDWTYSACDASFIFDGVYPDTHKCKFATLQESTVFWMGSSDVSYCYFNFIRLGDT